MRINLGTVDRAFRAVLGLGLLYLSFLSGLPIFDGAIVKYGAAIIGFVMLATAATRICPLYAVLGIRTCGS